MPSSIVSPRTPVRLQRCSNKGTRKSSPVETSCIATTSKVDELVEGEMPTKGRRTDIRGSMDRFGLNLANPHHDVGTPKVKPSYRSRLMHRNVWKHSRTLLAP